MLIDSRWGYYSTTETTTEHSTREYEMAKGDKTRHRAESIALPSIFQHVAK